MLTKSRCSSKTGWWLEIDGRPMAKFVRESDVDYILKLQSEKPSNAVFVYNEIQKPCCYSLGA